jgi:periplasmic divalent cation tolerance protein
MTGERFLVVLNTCPDRATAERLAGLLVAERAAACVNILPGLSSVYSWQGQIETASEFLLMIKTESGAYPIVEALLREHHPYETPEIVALNIAHGSSDYLQWIHQWVNSQ